MIVAHTVRSQVDLAYRDLFEKDLIEHELFGEMAREQLHYYPTVTREPFKYEGRITDRINSGAIFKDLGLDLDKFDPVEDRIMLCGSMAMIKEVAALPGSPGAGGRLQLRTRRLRAGTRVCRLRLADDHALPSTATASPATA